MRIDIIQYTSDKYVQTQIILALKQRKNEEIRGSISLLGELEKD